MRRLVLAAAMVVAAHGALAADMPDLPILRGFVNDGPPAARTTWQGFYAGGQAAYGSSEMDFTNATRDITAKLLNRTADRFEPTAVRDTPRGIKIKSRTRTAVDG